MACRTTCRNSTTVVAGEGIEVSKDGSTYVIAADGDVPQQINAQTGTSYTLALADSSKMVTLDNASPIDLTVPENSTIAYPVGTRIDIAQVGAGQVTVIGAGSVVVNSSQTLLLRAQYSSASLLQIATDTWLLVGDLEAA